VIQKAPDALTAAEVVERLLKAGTPLGRSTTINHLNALIREGRAKTNGEGKETRYFALELASTLPSWTQTGDDE
jgi:Fe2+ or Zn2+ uptake regulation protein